VSNLKSGALTVLELLVFNSQKLGGHATVARPLLGQFLGIMSGLSLATCLSNLKSVALTVLELLAFNSHDRTLRTHKQTHKHTHRQTHTHIERTHYLRHSLRSLGGGNKLLLPPACIRDPAYIGDPASIKTLSTCHARVITFLHCI